MTLSVVLITYNEESNLARTLESVRPLVRDGQGEIIVVDSGSTDRTVEIARSFGAKIFSRTWKGYAAQKNSAIEKATGDWILSLDADEELSARTWRRKSSAQRRNHDYGPFEWNVAPAFDVRFEDSNGNQPCRSPSGSRGRTISSVDGSNTEGFYPDRKLRLFAAGASRFRRKARGARRRVKQITTLRSYELAASFTTPIRRFPTTSIT